MKGGFRAIPVSQSFALTRALMQAGELVAATEPPSNRVTIPDNWDLLERPGPVVKASGAKFCGGCGQRISTSRNTCRGCSDAV